MTEICVRIKLLHTESPSVERLDSCQVVFLCDFNFDSNGVLSHTVVVLWEMDAEDFCDFVFVVFVHLEEVLDVLVVREGKLRKR